MVELRTRKLHVITSNAIEGITVRSGSLYTQHLEAARAVAADPQRYVYDLPLIHRLLFGGQSRPSHIGRQRLCGVMMVGKQSRHYLPPAREVPALMRTYYALVAQLLQGEPDHQGILAMHAISLCIHPFTDGNGRTTRLHLNAMRLAAGLDWYVITPGMRGRYYHYIRTIETEFFPLFRIYALERGT